jgi:hypothetical protein
VRGRRIVVTGYADDAHGIMRPRVTVAAPDMTEKAARLHAEAHERCFIANSEVAVITKSIRIITDCDINGGGARTNQRISAVSAAQAYLPGLG